MGGSWNQAMNIHTCWKTSSTETHTFIVWLKSMCVTQVILGLQNSCLRSIDICTCINSLYCLGYRWNRWNQESWVKKKKEWRTTSNRHVSVCYDEISIQRHWSDKGDGKIYEYSLHRTTAIRKKLLKKKRNEVVEIEMQFCYKWYAIKSCCMNRLFKTKKLMRTEVVFITVNLEFGRFWIIGLQCIYPYCSRARTVSWQAKKKRLSFLKKPELCPGAWD